MRTEETMLNRDCPVFHGGDLDPFEQGKKALDLWWSRVLEQSLESRAMYVGVFHISGGLMFANAGMKALLDAENPDHSPAQYLLHPDFHHLSQLQESENAVFEGVLTIGNGQDLFSSIEARVWKKGDQILILGEYNVEELIETNRTITDLNREISNLQRSLIKEKSTLDRTLKELKETQALLIHSGKMTALGQMVAGVAHEINNPIAFVHVNVNSLQDAMEDIRQAYEQTGELIHKEGSPGAQERAALISRQFDVDFIFKDFEHLFRSTLDGIVRIKEIVQNLRIFARLDEGEVKEVDLGESLRSALMIAGPELKRRRLNVILDLEEPLPRFLCYASELNQVFLNVILNGAQAMEDKGDLTIRAWQTLDSLCIDFQDTGQGIPDAILPRVFEPFFTTKPVGSGTGLGLSMAYKIITEKHRGQITLESQVGKGTTVRIRLPKDLTLKNVLPMEDQKAV